MRNASWLAITLGLSSVAPIGITTLTLVSPTWAQTAKRDADAVAAMNRARTQLQPIRQRLTRAEHAGRSDEKSAALDEMKRVLDDLAPIVEAYSGDTGVQKAIAREFDQWMGEYKAASSQQTADGAAFFQMMSQRWAEIARQVQADPAEDKPASFPELVKDPSIAGFGLPHTYAAVQALDRYVTEIQTHPDYMKNRTHENVVADLQNARKARAEAAAKLADAADAVLKQASADPLDQAGRDRVWAMVQTDLPGALSGSPRLEELQARARSLVERFDRDHNSDGSSVGSQRQRLTELADAVWPNIAGRYPAVGDDPMRAARGEIVHIRDAVVIAPNRYRPLDADLVLLVAGRPVVCVFDPVVKQHVKNILVETGQETLPPDGIQVIGVVRGMDRIDMVQQAGSSSAATNPAGGEGEVSARTGPALAATDCVTLDVLAIRAGPAAIGVDPTPAQVQARP